MYSRLENEFKSRSWYKRDTNFIIILYVVSLVIFFSIALILGSIWYSYGATVIILVALYGYAFIILHREQANKNIKFHAIKTVIHTYIKTRKEAELLLLVKVCKENSINTRPKILEAIKHYQVLVPRNIIGSGVFLSLVAMILSIFAFAYDESNALSSSRLQFMFSVFFLVSILYGFFKYTSDQILSIFGMKAFYKRMEDLLSTIYFQSLVR